MIGYIQIPSREVLYLYSFSESELTIYSHASSQNKTYINKTHLNFTSDYHTLVGIDIEKNRIIIFFVSQIPFVNDPIPWTSSTVGVYRYLVIYDEMFLLTGIRFRFPELDYFYSINNGITRNLTFSGPLSISIETRPYDETKTRFAFLHNGTMINCELSVMPTFHSVSKSPITLDSNLACKFEQTDNIDFLIEIYRIIKELFQFICYRKNIIIEQIEITGIDASGKQHVIGELHIFENDSTIIETNKIISKTLDYRLIESGFSKLIQQISNNKLYLGHIPESKKDFHRITPARFILITAAFEWNANNNLTIPLSKKRLQVKADVLESIQKISVEKSYSSNLKSRLKHYLNLVSNVDVNLSEKIVYALNKYSNILRHFIDNLYAINKLPVDSYEKMGDRIQTQRNAYAHGNISKDFDYMVVLDITILEWVIYCIVLCSLGYSDNNVYNIINSIFDRNFEPRED